MNEEFKASDSTFNQVFAGYLLAQRSRAVVARYLDMLERTRVLFTQRLGDPPIATVTPDDIRRWLIWLQGGDETHATAAPRGRDGQALSGAYVDIQFRNIKALFNWCAQEELILRSPVAKVKRPKFVERLPEALTETEALYLLEQVRTNGDRNAFRDYAIILCMLDTGVRLSELVHIKLDDVNLETGYAKVLGKGRKERIVPMGLELRRALSKYLLKYRRSAAGEVALFVNEHGWRLEGEGVERIVMRDLKKYIQRDLKRTGPHTLRHTFATFNLRKTRDLKATSMIMGHTSTKTTERYLHLTGADVLRNSEGSPMDDLIRNGGKTIAD